MPLWSGVTPDTLSPPSTIVEIEATFLTSDKLQQCYLVAPDNELRKYDADGNLLFQYTNNRLGTLEWVDATDPFNLLLYYPDYYTVVTLNRTLNPTGEYQLYDLNIGQIGAIAMASDNNLWLYDENAGTLKKIDRQGNVLVESTNIRLSLAQNIQPKNMLANDHQVYLNVPDRGILVFDNFGTFVKEIPLTGLKEFQIMDKQLLYLSENKLHGFHLQSLLTSEIQLPFPLDDDDQLAVQKGVLFLLKQNELWIYRLDG